MNYPVTELQTACERMGLQEAKKRLYAFYASFLDLYRDLLPPIIQDAVRTGESFHRGTIEADKLVTANQNCWDWIIAHRQQTHTQSYHAVRAANFITYTGEQITSLEDIYTDVDFFLYFSLSAIDHSAQVGPLLRTAFSIPPASG